MKYLFFCLMIFFINTHNVSAEIAHSDNCNKTTPSYSHQAYGSNCKWWITDDGVLIIENIDKTQQGYTGAYGYGAPWSEYGSLIKATVLDGITPANSYGLGMGGGIGSQIITINGGSINSNTLAYFGGQGRFSISNCVGNLNDCLLEKDLGCLDGYLYKDNTCVPSSQECGSNYISIENWCSRIRYTLPEADAATSDDNENMIEWIFE